MREEAAVRLADYRPPDYLIDEVSLAFELEPHATLVRAKSTMRRNGAGSRPLVLDGERAELVSIAIDGQFLSPDAYDRRPGGMIVKAPLPERFTLEIVTRLDPANNTALEGLYVSGGRFCTQCEAEGFRTITYFLDRPDVMARYEVRIEAEKAHYPTLLANGNLVESGDLANGRHYAIWRDPFPKPCYLFALVAGEFDILTDTFTTMSRRVVSLGIHVDPGERERAHFAMDSLKRAMRWDEEKFGREYDLDVFNIVAVRDFNFGAMENKGLNIFNSAYVLADPETASDADYEAIEAIVAHEYFHNWTGNRITCRDWFQLSLKEGLTVFRDQEFSADQRSRAVQRIKDVKRLRARQFPEDSGPLAHPVRPSSYMKIDNFYTATVYEKGSEVIRMLKTLIGPEAFARGMDLYFERRDGTASTVEDFIACFEEASARDLTHFKQWYGQAGAPMLDIVGAYDPAAKTYDLDVRQNTNPTPGQPDKQPMLIPLSVGLLAKDGRQLSERALVLESAEQSFRFEGIAEEPIPTLLRGFSAPVRVFDDLTAEQRLVQMAHDPDPFTRWEAGQVLARDEMLARAEAILTQGAPPKPIGLAEALGRELDRADKDAAFAALALRLPDLSELIHYDTPDPDGFFQAREETRRTIATVLKEKLIAIVEAPAEKDYSIDASAAGKRALKSAALDLLASLGPETEQVLWNAYERARAMTEWMAALNALGASGSALFDDALARFYEKWKHRPLVIDKWFAVQAAAPRKDALARAERLRAHPDFDLKNPNRVRSLAATFAMSNLLAFHAADGSGYRFLADIVGEVDGLNPALAARLLTAFESWKRFDSGRQAHARRALEGLNARANLSRNAREVAARTLG